MITYKEEIANKYSILNNEISNRSPLGRILLGNKLACEFLFLDENLKKVKYKIIKIVHAN